MNRRKSKHKEKLNIAMFGQKRILSREGGVEIVVEELCTRMVAFYNLMVRNNINLRVSCIEEGILSYNSQFDNDHGKIVEISHYTKPAIAPLCRQWFDKICPLS